MNKLNTYHDFINRVNELGFMSFNTIIKGFPAVTTETDQLFSNNPETDPWFWKDRCCAEKKLAFGDFFLGKKGFISPEFYSIFYLVYHPEETIEEQWENGTIDSMTWDLWKLLENKQTALSTSEIRKELGVSAKKGGSSLNNAILNLQLSFDITLVGGKQRIDKSGKPFGDPANLYDKVTSHIPKEWLIKPQGLDKETAKQIILERARAISTEASEKDLLKIFKFR